MLRQVELVLGNRAADRRHVGRVERRVAGVAAEHAEQPDAFVRADGGALPLDGRVRARDGRRKADAVLRVAHVVVHRLGDGDDFDARLVEVGGVAQRVVAADGHQVLDAQPLQVAQHLRSHVEDRRGDALLGRLRGGELLALRGTRGWLSSSAGSCGWCGGRCRRCGPRCACCRGSEAECSGPGCPASSRSTCVRPSQPRRMPITSQSIS